MKLISWNVNGLRACLSKGFPDFFHACKADIFCLQETKLQAGQVELDRAGYIVAGEDCKTSLAGVYAAGDTRTKELRQIITAAADGAVAAFEASNLINAGA